MAFLPDFLFIAESLLSLDEVTLPAGGPSSGKLLAGIEQVVENRLEADCQKMQVMAQTSYVFSDSVEHGLYS